MKFGSRPLNKRGIEAQSCQDQRDPASARAGETQSSKIYSLSQGHIQGKPNICLRFGVKKVKKKSKHKKKKKRKTSKTNKTKKVKHVKTKQSFKKAKRPDLQPQPRPHSPAPATIRQIQLPLTALKGQGNSKT